MVVSRHQNAGQDHNLLTANKSFENVSKFKYLGITKVKLSLCLIKHLAMKTYGEIATQLHAFLTSALNGGE